MYEVEAPQRPIPDSLVRIAKSLLPSHASWSPDVALVNYYREGDTLGGHIDDAEDDLEKPILSVSLGCNAIFLMGGEHRNIQPTALLLRGGDAVVLSGHARKCYHGVPRVLPPAEMKDIHCDEYADYMKTCRINVSIRQAKRCQVLDLHTSSSFGYSAAMVSKSAIGMGLK